MFNNGKKVTKIIVLFMLVTGCKTIGQKSSLTELEGFEILSPSDNPKDSHTKNYQKSWTSPCRKSFSSSSLTMLTINKQEIAMFEKKFAPDRQCQGEIVAETAAIYRYEVTIIENMKIDPNGSEVVDLGKIDMKMIRAGSIFKTQKEADHASRFQTLGLENWEVNVPQYKDFRDSAIFTLVGIVDGKLCFGENAEIWDDGSSQNKRHKKLDKDHSDCYSIDT